MGKREKYVKNVSNLVESRMKREKKSWWKTNESVQKWKEADSETWNVYHLLFKGEKKFDWWRWRKLKKLTFKSIPPSLVQIFKSHFHFFFEKFESENRTMENYLHFMIF